MRCILNCVAYKRRKPTWIRSADQPLTFVFPVSIEIIQAIHTDGPTSVANPGPRRGRKSISLHYHLNKLKQAGFLGEVGTRRSDAQTQSRESGAHRNVLADRLKPRLARDERATVNQHHSAPRGAMYIDRSLDARN